jgi:hypothetical protein
MCRDAAVLDRSIGFARRLTSDGGANADASDDGASPSGDDGASPNDGDASDDPSAPVPA